VRAIRRNPPIGCGFSAAHLAVRAG
jgi:hypothetical protein